MPEEISPEKTMQFRKSDDLPKPSSEMLQGKYGVWHVGPNRSPEEKRNIMTSHPYEKSDQIQPDPHKMRFFMIPMMQEMMRHRENRTRGWWVDRKHCKRGMGPGEMNPQKFQEILAKMRKVREENSANGTPFPHRHGFCRRMFSGHGKDFNNELQQDPILVPKDSNVFYHV